MTVESYIRAMPKVELDLQLEGAIPRKTLLMIADQNEIAASTKGFNKLKDALDALDFARLPELLVTVSQWFQHSDDLSRAVYDLGVALSKQNVRYAEIGLNPALYAHLGLSFDGLMEALNDGVDRARRGWNVQIGWILNIPREEPRRGDEVARWAMSAAARKNNVVALGLAGPEESQPAGQFERPFRTVEKKGMPRVAQAGETQGAEAIMEVINDLKPSRLVGGWGAVESQDLLNLFNEHDMPLSVCLTRVLRRKQITSYEEYPLRRLYDENIRLTLATIMPDLYKTTLADEYLAAVQKCGLEISELEEIALNAVRYSFMPNEERTKLISEFTDAYAQLRGEHIEETA